MDPSNSPKFIQRVLQNLWIAPESIITEQNRDHHRYRRATIASVANVAELASNALVVIVGVALALPYLGRDRLGIWLTVASFTSLLSFLDLGVGNALIGRVALAVANDDLPRSQVIVGGLGFMALLSLFIALFLLGATEVIPWQSILAKHARSSMLISELSSCARVFAIFFGVSLFSGAVRKVFQGLQQAYYGSLTILGGNILSMLALVPASHLHASPDVLLAITFGISATAPLILLPFLARDLDVPWHRTTHWIRKEAQHLLSMGGMFFLVQIGVLVNTASEALIISTVLGPVAVSLYLVAQKPFQFCSIPIRVLSNALWPSYADAYHRGDRQFIRKTLWNQLTIAAVVIAAATVLIGSTHRWLIESWTSHKLTVQPSLTIALAIWTLLEGITMPFSSFMNGCGKIRPQAIASVFSLLTLLPAKILALHRWGLSGMVFASSVFFAINLLLFYFILFPSEVFEPLRTSKPD